MGEATGDVSAAIAQAEGVNDDLRSAVSCGRIRSCRARALLAIEQRPAHVAAGLLRPPQRSRRRLRRGGADRILHREGSTVASFEAPALPGQQENP